MRPLGRWVIVAFAVGALACLLAYLHYAYRVGEDQFQTGGWRASGAGTAIRRVDEWVTNAKGPNWLEIGFMTVGGAITLALAKASYAIVGFPLHPIGYALAMCFAVEYNWPAFLLMWIIKGLALRYGGRGLYMRFIPFALGVTLSGLVTPVLWAGAAWLTPC